MNQIFKILSSLSDLHYVSGTEKFEEKNGAFPERINGFERRIDSVGNVLYKKTSGKKNAKKILVEAHLDTIGFYVKEITNDGFICAGLCGGFDKKILPGTQVVSCSENKRIGMICAIPPHLTKKDAENKTKDEEIYIDFGFCSDREAKNFFEIGDPILFYDPVICLSSHKICAPGLDNKAAVAALLIAMESAESENDLYFLFSVGEETTSRGVISIVNEINPDIAIVVDAGFAMAPGLNEENCIQMEKGPSVSITDTLTRFLTDWVLACALKNNLPLQTVCEPGGTGTSATKLQLQNGGIPSVVISIPLKNMHTPSEIVSEKDILSTCDLICTLIAEKEIPSQEATFIGNI